MTSDRSARAALAVWLGLVALVLARAAFAFVPSMWAWGFDLLRWIHPIPGWTLWALSAVTLIPPLGRIARPWLEALGKIFDGLGPVAYLLWGFVAAVLVWWFPDRVRFVGDFLLRFGTAERALQPSALFPQALPLDVFLHYTVPRVLVDSFHIDVNTGARLFGALEAGILAVLALAFARGLSQRGAFGVTAGAIVLFGGTLGMFTGYGKAVSGIALLTAAVAVLGLRVIREGRGLLLLSVCLALGLVLHRSALGLLPAAVLCWVLAIRQPQSCVRWSRPGTWLAAALPLAALTVMLPRIIGTFATMDSVHFTPPEVMRQGGILAAMFAGARPADLVDVVALLSPIALVLPAGLIAYGRWRAHVREGALLAALALPWLAMLLLIHPPQGMFRDWDNFTAAAVALSLMTAWLVSIAARSARGWAWLCVPAALGALAPSVQWLMHNADLERGLARVEAYLAQPPARSEEERAKTWDYLGIRYAQLDRWEQSAAAMRQAAALAPSPRVLLQWASAEQAHGDDRAAQAAYRRLLEVAPDEARGWFGLAFVSWRLGDLDECRRGARELLRLRPGNAQALEMLAQIDRAESEIADRRRQGDTTRVNAPVVADTTGTVPPGGEPR
ncbi:MAG TPA: tetratricopeptide repeat protein [Candidatus Eisenbacteria bacterium]|nr:tetratricopeptide repeat protein [Candidatus Eisenbacteria bacterium]